MSKHQPHSGNASANFRKPRIAAVVSPKRYYYLLSGRDTTGTITHDREWENFLAMEAAYDRLFQEPGIITLAESSSAIGNTERTEFYSIETPPPVEPGV